MNKELQMTHMLKVLLAVLVTIIVLGGGFLGWIRYNNSLVAGRQTIANSAQVKKSVDANQTEVTAIQDEIQKSDDIDISDLDNTSELDKIDLSGI